MIDVNEELFPLIQTPRHLPPPSRKVHPSTCLRWALKGVGRERIKLETKMIGGRRYTSKQAVIRFIDRLSGDAEKPDPQSRARAEVIRQAECELNNEGID